MKQHIVLSCLIATLLTACGSTPQRPESAVEPRTGDATPAKSAVYLPGDGPAEKIPPNLESTPDAVPKKEPLHPYANRPYMALGRSYTPLLNAEGYKEKGVASWYGKKFHGQRTSSGELYDMFGMTAAHPILPIPSYARVTNPANNKSVVVRINDRGPFLHERVIDLSYTAAQKLGIAGKGSGEVEVEALVGNIAPPVIATNNAAKTPSSATAPLTPAVAVQTKPLVKAEAATSTEVNPLDGKVYLQLAAFRSQDSAQSFVEKIRSDLGEVGKVLSLFNKDGLFRVHLGPYANQTDARKIAESLQDKLGFKPVLSFR